MDFLIFDSLPLTLQVGLIILVISQVSIFGHLFFADKPDVEIESFSIVVEGDFNKKLLVFILFILGIILTFILTVWGSVIAGWLLAILAGLIALLSVLAFMIDQFGGILWPWEKKFWDNFSQYPFLLIFIVGVFLIALYLIPIFLGISLLGGLLILLGGYIVALLLRLIFGCAWVSFVTTAFVDLIKTVILWMLKVTEWIHKVMRKWIEYVEKEVRRRVARWRKTCSSWHRLLRWLCIFWEWVKIFAWITVSVIVEVLMVAVSFVILVIVIMVAMAITLVSSILILVIKLVLWCW